MLLTEDAHTDTDTDTDTDLCEVLAGGLVIICCFRPIISCMKIIHLLSNWKWTGPAEPVLNLCLSLKNRGHDVAFACGAPPPGCNNIVEMKAIQRGINPITQFKLKKHFRFIDNTRDFFGLQRFFKMEGFDIVHTHLSNDHLIAGLAARRMHKGPKVIRTNYSGTTLPLTWRNKFLFSRLTDGLITSSENDRKGNIEIFKLREDTVCKVEGAIDMDRFNPENKRQDLRGSLGIGQDEIVVGIVARVQRHRQFDLLLDAVSRVVKVFQGLKLLIIGRGTHINEIAVKPSREIGIDKNVIFSGYRDEDYVDVMACMDINIFLVPGTDGTCRAVREAMAMAKPVIASSRGILPELVIDGQIGILVDESTEGLSEAILKLVYDKELRVRMGNAAREKALREFSLDKQAERVEEFYGTLI